MSSVYVITADDIEDHSADYIFTSLDVAKSVFSDLTGISVEDVHLTNEFRYDGKMNSEDWLVLHYKMFPESTYRYLSEYELDVMPE